MSRKEIIQCDGCAATCSGSLPPGWYTLQRSGDLVKTGKMVSTPAYDDKGHFVTNFKNGELLFSGGETLHFCSQDCLWNYIIDNWQIGNEHTGKTVTTYEFEVMPLMCKPLSDGRIQALASGEVYQLVKPEYQARRFLLFDEAANQVEGVLWANGRVTVERSTGIDILLSWESFRGSYPGGGVQWIDQPEPRTGGVITSDTIAIVGEAGLGETCFNAPDLTLNWRGGGKE